MDREDAILMRNQLLEPELTERTLRLFAAAEAKVWGRGGISGVSRALELSRARIYRGLQELEQEEKLEPQRIRRKGGGCKSRVEEDATLKRDLERLVSPYTRGDPESPLRWTCKSIRQLAKELTRQGHKTSHRMVAELLREMGYSLQANRKTIEGKQHPDRDAQFKYINQQTQKQQRASQ